LHILCKRHRESLKGHSTCQLNELSEQWITNAIEHYEFERWDYALPYSWSALELCWIEADKYQSISTVLAIKSLCLAIYCSNILHHLCDAANSETILAKNWYRMSHKMPTQMKSQLGALCSNSSSRSELHNELIKQHTSWPFKTESGTRGLILH
jgi:hypothetical protein